MAIETCDPSAEDRPLSNKSTRPGWNSKARTLVNNLLKYCTKPLLPVYYGTRLNVCRRYVVRIAQRVNPHLDFWFISMAI